MTSSFSRFIVVTNADMRPNYLVEHKQSHFDLAYHYPCFPFDALVVPSLQHLLRSGICHRLAPQSFHLWDLSYLHIAAFLGVHVFRTVSRSKF